VAIDFHSPFPIPVILYTSLLNNIVKTVPNSVYIPFPIIIWGKYMKYINKMTIILTIFLFLIPNSMATVDGIYQNDVEITVDQTSKYVKPGQEAIFYWYVCNNLTFETIEFHVSSTGNITTFSQSQFTLGPKESIVINQYCPTLINDLNDTRYSYYVTWSGRIKLFALTYNMPSQSGTLYVTVIDEKNYNDDYNEDLDYLDNQNSINNMINFGIIILIIALIIVFWKYLQKRKKNQLS
jgi:hypothetical protein